ncbi:alpha/beta hydrolase [Sphingopyxis sp. DBS4]|uniref:alpha/beta hydrolase n=1 Tax=Sphingopyxis sp. DBS4 TaxID=2968500 RepID=UPI00214BBC31|nr:alpha/beta hydrolase [Sphingopyxis sp. DBS4]
MPIDPVLAPLLDMIGGLPHMNPPFDVAALRLADEQPMPVFRAEVAEVRDLTLDTAAGPIPARLYHPAPGTELPLLFFLHGGGWVFGTIETHDPLCRALASAAEVAVLSLDYPRAPEHRHPVALDAMHAALVAAAAQADALGIDPARIAVGGDSAGGNLSAALCLKLRDEGGPAVAHQLLFYPVIDNDFTRASYVENGAGYFLSSAMMQWFWAQYLGDAGGEPGPLAAPIRAASLAGLPSATVITAEYDPLRDEGNAYAERLAAEGVAVTHSQTPGVIHGFASMLGMLPQADVAVGTAAKGLRHAFGLMEAAA